MLMLPFFNYADGDRGAIYEMLQSPAGVSACPTAARTAA